MKKSDFIKSKTGVVKKEKIEFYREENEEVKFFDLQSDEVFYYSGTLEEFEAEIFDESPTPDAITDAERRGMIKALRWAADYCEIVTPIMCKIERIENGGDL